MSKKYVVMGGEVISKTDGDRHYVDSPTLMRLYGLSREEAVLMEETEFKDIPNEIYRYEQMGLQVLRPRFDGNYSLNPEKTGS
jgi:hypothetical protein